MFKNGCQNEWSKRSSQRNEPEAALSYPEPQTLGAQPVLSGGERVPSSERHYSETEDSKTERVRTPS